MCLNRISNIPEQSIDEHEEIYNNGALKITHYIKDNFIAKFRLDFDCAGIKKVLFLTKDQFEIMKEASTRI